MKHLMMKRNILFVFYNPSRKSLQDFEDIKGKRNKLITKKEFLLDTLGRLK